MTKGSCKLNLPRGIAQRIFKDKRKYIYMCLNCGQQKFSLCHSYKSLTIIPSRAKHQNLSESLSLHNTENDCTND